MIARQLSTPVFPEQIHASGERPSIAHFRTALFHCFLIASTTYIFLHNIWLGLEIEEAQESYEGRTLALEKQIQGLLDEKKENIQKKRHWYSIRNFWR